MKKLLLLSFILLSMSLAQALQREREVITQPVPGGGIQYANIKTGVAVTKLPNNQYEGHERPKSENELRFLRSSEEKPTQEVLKSVYKILETQYKLGL